MAPSTAIPHPTDPMITSPYLLAALIVAITGLAFWLDLRFAWARTVGATMLVIGVVVGLLGYAVGNYLGLGVACWVRGLLG